MKTLSVLVKKLDKAEAANRLVDRKKAKLASEISQLRSEVEAAAKLVQNPPRDEAPRTAASSWTGTPGAAVA
jgi:hypothetical protein